VAAFAHRSPDINEVLLYRPRTVATIFANRRSYWRKVFLRIVHGDDQAVPPFSVRQEVRIREVMFNITPEWNRIVPFPGFVVG
jgi:hypothetical protein